MPCDFSYFKKQKIKAIAGVIITAKEALSYVASVQAATEASEIIMLRRFLRGTLRPSCHSTKNSVAAILTLSVAKTPLF